MTAKANLKPCQTSTFELLSKLLPATGENAKSCQKSKMELFAKIINDCKGKFETLSNI